jgi:3-phosphoshikimate 1-carboxyvinyltransferase
VPASEVRIENVGLNPTRNALFQAFSDMGLEVKIEAANSDAVEPWGRLRAHGRELRGIEVGPERVTRLIDELPAIAVAAAFAHGTTTVRGAGELRVKESDRLQTMTEGLEAVGARVELLPDGWRIHGSGGKRLRGGEVRSRGDHRVAMSLLVAGLGCENGVRVLDPPGIQSSDPFFMNNLKQIQEVG